MIGGTWDDVLAAALPYAPSLGSLRLDSCLLGEPIPACVLQATRLTSLSLANSELEACVSERKTAAALVC